MEDNELSSLPVHLDDLEQNMMELSDEDSTNDESMEDLTETPEMTFTRVLAMSDEMPQKPEMLNEMGDTFLSLFESTRAECDINNAVLAYELAVNLLPATDNNLACFLCDYGISVTERYELTGIVADIDRAISSHRSAVQHTPEGHADMPMWLNYLGNSLVTRFERTEEFADISEAVSLHQKSIQLTPKGHTGIPIWLNNLGRSLQKRFLHIGELADIFEAISLQEKSIQLTPEGHASLSGRMIDLGTSLKICFLHTGELADISESISLQQKSIQTTPAGHASLPGWLNNLGSSLQTRFERTGELADISEAISLQQKSIQLTPEHDVLDLPIWLNNLGISHQILFEHTGEFSDISEAISLQEKSIQLTPEDDTSLCGRMNDLAISLQMRFLHTGDLADISEAISLQQKSIQTTPDGHADLPGRLNSLGSSLRTCFERTGELADISEAISLQQKSIQLIPDGHAYLPVYLNNLEISLQTRVESTGELADISKTISLRQKSIHLIPDGHASLPVYLNNLGYLLVERFDSIGDFTDISEAISLHQKSIQLTPEGHATQPTWLNNLGMLFLKRFERTVDLADVSEALSLMQKSIQLTPEGHADLPDRLNNLGILLEARFEQTTDVVDVQSAILHYRLCATSVSGSPSTRLSAGKAWARLARQEDKSQLLDAYHHTLCLISQVAGLDQTIQNRYINLINISELSSSAAAAAIDLGQHSLALEWLEQGRCLVWSQLNDLRTPIDDLRVHYPVLADDIVRVSRALENAGSRAEPASYTEQTSMMTKMSIQDEAHTHIKLAQEWEQLLIKVRAIPQFEDFLRPASCSTLLKAIRNSGYVVVINIHKNRSDALVLTSGATEPLHIALPDFPYEKADILRHQMKALLLDSRIRMRGFELDDSRGSRRYVPGIADILRQLWTFVVKPILDGIGHSAPAAIIPRIWWCVTGPLAFLPLHAAGIYPPSGSNQGTYTTLSDFAISSYTPTVRSLVGAINKSRAISPEKKGLLAISQPDTPGQCRIPGTTAEVTAIQRLLTNQKVEHLLLASGDATVTRVKEQMETYSCVHFACHAAQNTTKPLQSGFYLYDGRLELSEIIKKHLLGADLAFLSACQTSTGDEKLSEEAVHLAGGMLAAGYGGGGSDNVVHQG